MGGRENDANKPDKNNIKYLNNFDFDFDKLWKLSFFITQ